MAIGNRHTLEPGMRVTWDDPNPVVDASDLESARHRHGPGPFTVIDTRPGMTGVGHAQSIRLDELRGKHPLNDGWFSGAWFKPAVSSR